MNLAWKYLPRSEAMAAKSFLSLHTLIYQEFNLIFQVTMDLPVKANWFSFVSVIDRFNLYVRLYLFRMYACGFPKSSRSSLPWQVLPHSWASAQLVLAQNALFTSLTCLILGLSWRSSLTTLPTVECLLVSPSLTFVFLHNIQYRLYQFIFLKPCLV